LSSVPECLHERGGLGGVLAAGQLVGGRLELGEALGSGSLVLALEVEEFLQDVAASWEAGVAEDLSAGDDLIGDAAEAGGDFDVGFAGVLAGGLPVGGQRGEVAIASEQVVGDGQDRGAELTVGTADQRAVGVIDLVALVAAGIEAGASGDRAGVGVVGDGTHFAGEVGGGDDMDAGEGQEQDVGGASQVCGDLLLQGLDFVAFLPAVVVEQQGDREVPLGGDVGRRGLACPDEQAVQRALLEADAILAEPRSEAFQSGLANRLGRAQLAGQVQGQRAFPELGEAGGVAGQRGVEMLADLTAEGRALVDQIAAVPDQQLEFSPGPVERGLGQGEAAAGGAVDGRQIGVVGFLTGVAGLAELLGGKGVDDADLEAGGGEGVLNRMVIAAGAFDGDQEVLQAVSLDGVAERGQSGLELAAVMGHEGRRYEDLAIEVAEHPLGAGLGGIDADDAEMFGADPLDSGVEGASRLLEHLRPARAALLSRTCSSHGNYLLERRDRELPNSPRR